MCPHCGGVERITAIKPNPEKRVRFGLKKCGQCKGQFTVRMGTIFEESKLPMTKWLQAIFLMCSSKKGVSANQLGRTLEVTCKTAWFLAHRIREAMRTGSLPRSAAKVAPMASTKDALVPAGMRKAVFTLDEGDVTLVFSDNLSPDGYEELGEYLKIFLRRAQRQKAGTPEQ